MLAFALVLFSLQQPSPSPAPTSGLPPQVGDTSPFRRLTLPTPNLIRATLGSCSPRYWQQRADYTIRASLDTANHVIAGSETIRYTNNSPDTLRYVWLQLDQNIYKANSRGAALNPTDARFAGRGFEGGYTIEYVRAVRRIGQAAGRIPLTSTDNGTMMRVELDRPLAPGGGAELELAYRFEVPEHGSDRMGREQFPGGWLYEVAQWYPRVAVYDDVRGWNTEQYLGQGEFYLEYGDFDVSITVPRSFVVAATGTLTNAVEVLTAGQRARLVRAARVDSTVAIIPKTEVGQPFTRPAGPRPMLTWHFTAKNVRDVAWAAAPNFIWDASGYDGILIQSFYPPEANADWARSTEYARHSIKHYSEKWLPYPYPTAINVAGPVGGMEYPMIVFCGHRAGSRALFGVTTHELGHQWFPMIVGSNERLYAWMDEGFNTFMNIYSTLAFYHETAPHDRGGALRRDRARCTVDAPGGAGSPAAPGRGGIRQAGNGPVPPARAHPCRHRTIRRRIPCVHPALGLQASHPGGLLPLHGGRARGRPLVVLARLVLPDRRRGPGGGLGAHPDGLRRDQRARLSLEPWRAPDARRPAAQLRQRRHGGRAPPRRDLVLGEPLHLPAQSPGRRREGRDRSRAEFPGCAAEQQCLAKTAVMQEQGVRAVADRCPRSVSW